MKLKFSKMHGLGNDFVVLDGIRQPLSLTPDQLRHLADRHFGVGCDQILLVETAGQPGVDFRYRIFNADGGEVEQCGNGARCFVRFVHDAGLTAKREINVETQGGIITPRLEDDGNVTVNMGIPRFLPAEIPFLGDGEAVVHALDVAGETLEISVVSMGNPHAVQLVDDVDRAPVGTQGPLIENHERFPQRVNAGFMQIVGPPRHQAARLSSAVRARRWPAVPAPAPRQWPGYVAACSIRRCASRHAAAISPSPGRVRASRS